jgi:NAD(P)-dependent dehydrogenase (short-subunit alcohol dehydrogenase family)
MQWIKQFSLENKVVMITGAAGGLGRELVRAVIDAGAKVILVDLNQSALEALIKQENIPADKHLLHICNVIDKSAIEKLIHAAHAKFGRIDVLINSAGILGPDVLMFDIQESDWDDVLSVNLKGTWLMSTEIARYMVKHTIHGNIINISSGLGYRSQYKRVAYATSKAGVEHMTRNMAMELVKHNIRVNCLAPGWMNTPMVEKLLNGPQGKKIRQTIPMGRAAEATELTGALLLLASEASSYMTGNILRVDGGLTYCGIEGAESLD